MAANASSVEITAKWQDRASAGIKKLDGQLQTMRKGLLVIAAAGVAAGVGLVALIKNVANLGDQMQKMGLRTGVSTEFLSGLSLAAQLSGESLETFEAGIRRLARNMSDADAGLETAQRAFSDLGVSVYDSQGKLRGVEDMFFELTDKLGGYENATKQAALAQELFGRGGTALIPLLKQGSAAIKEQMELAKRYGIVISQEAADKAANFNDRLTELKAIFKGVAITLGNELIPALTPFIEKMKEVALQLKDKASVAFKGLRQDVEDFYKRIDWDGLSKKIGDFVQKIIDFGKWAYENKDIIAKVFVIATIVALIPQIYALSAALLALSANPIMLGLAALGVTMLAVQKILEKADEKSNILGNKRAANLKKEMDAQLAIYDELIKKTQVTQDIIKQIDSGKTLLEAFNLPPSTIIPIERVLEIMSAISEMRPAFGPPAAPAPPAAPTLPEAVLSDLEKAYELLGEKSAIVLAKMKNDAISAFKIIKASGTETAERLVEMWVKIEGQFGMDKARKAIEEQIKAREKEIELIKESIEAKDREIEQAKEKAGWEKKYVKYLEQTELERRISLIFDADASRVENAVDFAAFAVGKFVGELRGISPAMDMAINVIAKLVTQLSTGNIFGAFATIASLLIGSRGKEEIAIHELDRAIQKVTASTKGYTSVLRGQALGYLEEARRILETELTGIGKDLSKFIKNLDLKGYGKIDISSWESLRGAFEYLVLVGPGAFGDNPVALVNALQYLINAMEAVEGIAAIGEEIALFGKEDLRTFKGKMAAYRHALAMDDLKPARKLEEFKRIFASFIQVLEDGSIIIDAIDLPTSQIWELQEMLVALGREFNNLSDAARTAEERTIGLKYAAEEMAMRAIYSEKFRQAGGSTYEIERLRGQMIREADVLRQKELEQLKNIGQAQPVVDAIETQTQVLADAIMGTGGTTSGGSGGVTVNVYGNVTGDDLGNQINEQIARGRVRRLQRFRE